MVITLPPAAVRSGSGHVEQQIARSAGGGALKKRRAQKDGQTPLAWPSFHAIPAVILASGKHLHHEAFLLHGGLDGRHISVV
jgi:hypothetical protein